MKNHLKFAAVAVCLSAVINLAGCSGNSAADTSASDSSAAQPAQTAQTDNAADTSVSDSSAAQPVQTDSAAEPTAEAPSEPQGWYPEVAQRAQLEAADSLCGVAYIGYVEPDKDKNASREAFLSGEYAGQFDTLADIPDEYIASSNGGMDLFLIIPAQGCSAVVYAWDMAEEEDFRFEKGEVLLESENGAPFLLKCNRSDIMPDTLIEITDEQGQTLSWSPSISLKDGTVYTDNISGTSSVYDFTDYSGLAIS